MSERLEKDFMNDIKEAIRRISIYTEDMSYEDFLVDIKTQDAVIRIFSIIRGKPRRIVRISSYVYSDKKIIDNYRLAMINYGRFIRHIYIYCERNGNY